MPRMLSDASDYPTSASGLASANAKQPLGVQNSPEILRQHQVAALQQSLGYLNSSWGETLMYWRDRFSTVAESSSGHAKTHRKFSTSIRSLSSKSSLVYRIQRPSGKTLRKHVGWARTLGLAPTVGQFVASARGP